jgi:hypothetical protein
VPGQGDIRREEKGRGGGGAEGGKARGKNKGSKRAGQVASLVCQQGKVVQIPTADGNGSD